MINRTSPVPQWVADLGRRRMLDANEAALKFWRMTQDQFLTTDIERFFHKDEVERWENYIDQQTWGESGPWRCTRGDGTIFYCTIRWHMMEYQGVYSAFVFPLRAGDLPTTMVDVEFKQPANAKPAGTSSD
jgi:PAS domain-containing protein